MKPGSREPRALQMGWGPPAFQPLGSWTWHGVCGQVLQGKPHLHVFCCRLGLPTASRPHSLQDNAWPLPALGGELCDLQKLPDPSRSTWKDLFASFSPVLAQKGRRPSKRLSAPLSACSPLGLH